MPWRSLTQRSLQAELMDSPSLPARDVEHALRGLARLNAVSRAPDLIWREIRPHVRAGASSLLDVATGGGDVPLALHRLAVSDGCSLSLAGCDLRPEMRSLVEANALAAGVPLRVFSLDAIRDPPPESFDIITVSLFTHHLTDDEVVGLLTRLSAAARRVLVVSDLARSESNLAMVSLVSRVVTRSRVVHHDAALSVRAAFTPAEFITLSRRAGLHQTGEISVRSAWPCRFVFTWRPRRA